MDLTLLSGEVPDDVGGAALGRSGTREEQALRGQTQRITGSEGSQIWQADQKSIGLATESRWRSWQVGDIWER